MADQITQSFNTPEYSGFLFAKGNEETPFTSMIGGSPETTNHVEFVTGQQYATETGEQPAISETASLTAPEAKIVTRSQNTNVTQIFQYAVGISYAKESNMGTLSGLNIANQAANPISELDFQTARRLAKCNQDLEYTFINGVLNKATNDTEVNKTCGIVPAVKSHVMAAASSEMDIWMVADLIKEISEDAPATNLTLCVDAVTLLQLNASCAKNGLTIVSADRTINGIQIMQILTPFGMINVKKLDKLPASTALLLDIPVIHPVFQPVPGKGNFFLEELAKTGAGAKYQLFGQAGLDYGPEWYHGKITGLSTTYTKPAGKNVIVANTTTNPVNTKTVS